MLNLTATHGARGSAGQLRKLGDNQTSLTGSWPSGPFRNIYFQDLPQPNFER